MSWLTDLARPKIKDAKNDTFKDVPDNLWSKCPKCDGMLYHKDLEKNDYVCNHCGYPLRLSPEKRLDLLFDDDSYEVIELPEVKTDPLNFKDLKRYSDRLKEYRKKTGSKADAITVAIGKVGGYPTVVGVFNFEFGGGSMGTAVGEGIIAAAELAVLEKAALILVPSSGGARMQEGILSLMQMSRTVFAINHVKDNGLPYIVIMSNPVMGGVTASFAMLGDIIISEPYAEIGFAGRIVIERFIREELPENFLTADYLKEHGMVDMVVAREDLPKTLKNIFSVLCAPAVKGLSKAEMKDTLSPFIKETRKTMKRKK